MCVIIHKPASVMLSKKILRKCFIANNDGFGVAYRDNGIVKYTKGLLTLDQIYTTLNPIMHLELAIHFRLATHGKTDHHNAHPFFLASTPRKTKGIDTSKSIALLMHNGVISHLGTTHYSDTVDLCTRILSKCKDIDHIIDILDLIGDKFLLITTEKMIKVGKYVEHKACYFSNLNWDYTVKTYGAYTAAHQKQYGTSLYSDDSEFYDDLRYADYEVDEIDEIEKAIQDEIKDKK